MWLLVTKCIPLNLTVCAHAIYRVSTPLVLLLHVSFSIESYNHLHSLLGSMKKNIYIYWLFVKHLHFMFAYVDEALVVTYTTSCYFSFLSSALVAKTSSSLVEMQAIAYPEGPTTAVRRINPKACASHRQRELPLRYLFSNSVDVQIAKAAKPTKQSY